MSSRVVGTAPDGGPFPIIVSGSKTSVFVALPRWLSLEGPVLLEPGDARDLGMALINFSEEDEE